MLRVFCTRVAYHGTPDTITQGSTNPRFFLKIGGIGQGLVTLFVDRKILWSWQFAMRICHG